MAYTALPDRCLSASKFLTTQLTSRERILVAAYSLGFTPSQVAKALEISPAAVTQMARRIQAKAEAFWRQ